MGNLLLISATALAGMVQKTMKQRLPKMPEATADANAENVSNRSRPIVQSVWLAMACPAKPCVAVGPRVGPRVGPQVECVVAPPGIQVGLPVESKRDPCLNRWFDMGGHGWPWCARREKEEAFD